MRYAVVTQACTDRPCRSSAMVRIEVATIVWSSAARNMPAIRPDRIVRICRWLSSPRRRSARRRWWCSCGLLDLLRLCGGREVGQRAALLDEAVVEAGQQSGQGRRRRRRTSPPGPGRTSAAGAPAWPRRRRGRGRSTPAGLARPSPGSDCRSTRPALTSWATWRLTVDGSTQAVSASAELRCGPSLHQLEEQPVGGPLHAVTAGAAGGGQLLAHRGEGSLDAQHLLAQGADRVGRADGSVGMPRNWLHVSSNWMQHTSIL